MTNTAYAYIDTRVSHTGDIFESSGDFYSCRMCHQGFPNGGTAATNFIFEGYRCLACHSSINSTHELSGALINSSHRGLLCTNCHDIVHAGHSRQRGYYTIDTTQDIYGCYGGRCHYVIADRLDPPAQQTFTTWVNTYYSSIRGYINWQLTHGLYTINIADQYEIYPYSFINPFNGNTTEPIQTNLYKSCLKCHFTNPGSEQTGTMTYGTSHSDICYNCHSSNIDNVQYNMAPHSISETVNGLYCTRCHTSVATSLSGSVHKNLQCNYCHAFIHIPGFNQTGSWMTIYYPESGPIITPSITELVQGRRIFYYSADNTSLYQIPVRPVSRGRSYTLVLPVYTLRWDASIVLQYDNTNITCFNCHFVGWYDPVVAAYSVKWNISSFGDPHSIKVDSRNTIPEFGVYEAEKLPTKIMLYVSLLSIIFVMVIKYVANRSSNNS